MLLFIPSVDDVQTTLRMRNPMIYQSVYDSQEHSIPSLSIETISNIKFITKKRRRKQQRRNPKVIHFNILFNIFNPIQHRQESFMYFLKQKLVFYRMNEWNAIETCCQQLVNQGISCGYYHAGLTTAQVC